MSWLQIFQTTFYIIGAVLSVCSIYAIFEARRQYKRGLRQRTGENLLELEKRFMDLEGTLPLIDPESKRYDKELKFAVEHSLKEAPPEERSDSEKQLILGLDRFLRFMLLLTALVEYELIRVDALNYEYWYWFKAIRDNDHLRKYAEKYFPTLHDALDDERLTTRFKRS